MSGVTARRCQRCHKRPRRGFRDSLLGKMCLRLNFLFAALGLPEVGLFDIFLRVKTGGFRTQEMASAFFVGIPKKPVQTDCAVASDYRPGIS